MKTLRNIVFALAVLVGFVAIMTAWWYLPWAFALLFLGLYCSHELFYDRLLAQMPEPEESTYPRWPPDPWWWKGLQWICVVVLVLTIAVLPSFLRDITTRPVPVTQVSDFLIWHRLVIWSWGVLLAGMLGIVAVEIGQGIRRKAWRTWSWHKFMTWDGWQDPYILGFGSWIGLALLVGIISCFRR